MTTEELIAKLKADPRTTWAAVVIGGIGAAGEYLHQAHIEPWGAALLGVSGFIGIGALAFSSFSPPKQLPPSDQDKTPPGGTQLGPPDA